MNSTSIKKLLEKRHSSDLFFCEVKTGSTWYSHYSIIDALAIPKSWRNFSITAYEIKVSRSDFLQDNKWPNYLPYCNEFYFAVPNNMIEPSELSDGVGLIYCTEKTTRKIKKASRRDIENNKVSDMFFHLMMKHNMRDDYPFHSGKTDFWKDWLENKKSNKEIGWRVRSKIADQLMKLTYANESMTKSVNELKEIKDVFEKYNRPTWNLVSEIEDILANKNSFNKTDIQILENVIRNISKVIKQYSNPNGEIE